MTKLQILTKYHQELTAETRYKITEDNLNFMGIKDQLNLCKDDKAVYHIAESITRDYIMGDTQLKKYIDENYGEFAVTESAVKNFLKYGYLKNSYTSAGSKKIIAKSDVDNIFNSNIIELTAEDYYQALGFSLQMLDKVKNLNIRFGTFFDKIAKRNGTALNYIDRHITGKLGEIAAIKVINSKLQNIGSNFIVENSFKIDQVEAADIVQLRDKKNVIVNANKKVQIKTGTGLNTVVLKEDKTKLDSDTFKVDYCILVQLLNSPLNFLIQLLGKINEQYLDNRVNHLSNILNNISLDNNSIIVTAKIAGYAHIDDMVLIKKGQILQPLGEINADSYYSYVSDLKSDFELLAEEIIP